MDLVTGGTGFIGNTIAQNLISAGGSIRILSRKGQNINNSSRQSKNSDTTKQTTKTRVESEFEPDKPNKKNKPASRFESSQDQKPNNPEISVGDVTNLKSCEEACTNIETIYHCAGVLGGWGIANQKFWDVNVNGTKNMLEGAVRAGVKRFVHMSSCGVFGPLKTGEVADETHPYNPINIYEKTKTEGEKLVLSYADKIDITIVRPEFVYGPGDLHLLSFFQAVKSKKFVFFNGGKSTIHPTYIDDVVDGVILAARSKNAVGESFNIAGPKPVTVVEFVNEMANVLGTHPPTISIPSPIPELAGILLDNSWGLVAKPPLSFSQVRYLTENRAFRYDKASKLLRYRPKVDINTGLEKTTKWYKKNNIL